MGADLVYIRKDSDSLLSKEIRRDGVKLLQFKLVKDVIPKYMITPTDYRFVADELYALGKDLLNYVRS